MKIIEIKNLTDEELEDEINFTKTIVDDLYEELRNVIKRLNILKEEKDKRS